MLAPPKKDRHRRFLVPAAFFAFIVAIAVAAWSIVLLRGNIAASAPRSERETAAPRAGEKLRRHGLVASHLTVFAHSNLFNGDPPFSASTTEGLIEASSDGLVLIAAASGAARRIWRPGAKLAKAGVILDDLVRAADAPAALIGGRDREKAARMMAAIDAVNARHGRGAVTSAAVGFKKVWATKFEMRSPRYTTRVDELPTAKALT